MIETSKQRSLIGLDEQKIASQKIRIKYINDNLFDKYEIFMIKIYIFNT